MSHRSQLSDGSIHGCALTRSGALFCLSSYATPHGGLEDMRDLLEQMAWQVRELGLHKIATSQLYPPQDMVQPLTAAFVYTDMSVSSLAEIRGRG